MKNRKLFIGLFLLISLLFLGVGYAALSNTLNIGGSISATKNDENLKVEFVGSELHAQDKDGKEDTTFLVKSTTAKQDATITVENISTLGQTAVVEFKIVNNSEVIKDPESLTATLKTAEVDVKLVVAGKNAQDSKDALNVFEGDHFSVEAEFIEKEVAGETQGDFADGVVSLAPGEYIYLRVTIKLIEVVSETLDVHNINITFNASTK